MHRLLIIISIALLATSGVRADAAELVPQLRRPIALAASKDFKWLYVANRDSGSISIIDVSTQSVSNEIVIGGRLSDLTALDDTHLLALDQKHHQLIMLTGKKEQWKIATKLDIAHYPVRMQLDLAAKRCYITSLWSQTVTMIDLSEVDRKPEPRISIAAKLSLPFEPREMCLTRDGKQLIVAGAYKNAFAVIGTNGLKLVVIKEIPGHNIRGLEISDDGQRVLVAQQELNALAHSTHDDVHWGNMITNLLVSLSLVDLSDPQADILKRRNVFHLGMPGKAAGDPGPIAFTSTGKLTVLLSGVNEIAIKKDQKSSDFHRVSVGRRPSAVMSSPDSRLFVADLFSDSISIVDVDRLEMVARIPLGPLRKLSAAERGEILFFDSQLSLNGWMSCHSCHTEGHSSDQLNDNFSDGSFGTPKRVLSLMGVGQTGPWAWDGKVKSLTQQVQNSIQNTMQGKTPSIEQVSDLEAFLKTLPPPPAPSVFNVSTNHAALKQGRNLFKTLNCERCHLPTANTSPETYDVGLKDEAGNTRFNPPSLLAVSRRTSFFHDGRARTLKDVFSEYKHQINRKLSEVELNALLQFLNSL